MAEHTIQNDPDPLFRRLGAKCRKLLPCAEQGIRLFIISGIIAVVFMGFKNGIEIDAGDPQGCEIGQFLADPLEVPSVIVPVDRVFPSRGEGRGGLFIGLVDPVGERHGFSGPPFTKSVRENLVDHTAFEK